MSLSRQHYAYVGMLVLAVAAFLADRLLLGAGTPGPNPAAASTRTAPESQEAGSRPQAAGTAAGPFPQPAACRPQPPWVERLAALAKARGADPAASRDAFALQEPWRSQLKKPAPEALPEPPPPSAPPAVFADKHKLTAVMMTGKGGSAIVDGRMLRMGQEIGGYKLIGLKPGRAVFQAGDGGEEVELSILQGPR